MTTTTRPRTVTADTVETQTAPAPTVAARRRSTSWVQALKDRRSNRSDLARTIAAYPATRSAAAYILPTPQIAAGQAPAVIPSADRQQQGLPAHLNGSRWSDAVG